MKIKPLAFLPLGDSAVIIQLGNAINLSVHRQVQSAVQYLEDHPFPGFIECVPSYTTISVHYDLLGIRGMEGCSSIFDSVCRQIEEVLNKVEIQKEVVPVIVDIPVCYGGEHGPDLEAVASFHNLTPKQVIDIHSGQDYLVYALGFAPGFPYIGGVSEQIATPRLTTPRIKVPAGSVGIAGNQTGIYPIETPGGWQIIGCTPLALFQPEQQPPTLLQGGQYIRFRPINKAQFDLLKGGGDL